MGLFGKDMNYEQALQVMIDESSKSRDVKAAFKVLNEFNKYSTVYHVGRILCIARELINCSDRCLEINRCLRDAEKNTPREDREREIYTYLKHPFVFDYVNYFYEIKGIYQAAFYVANCYLYGWGVEKDKNKAYEAAKLAAQMDKDNEFYFDADNLCTRLSLITGMSANPTDSTPTQENLSEKEYKTICYDSGTIYEGEVKNGKPHGKGKYTSTKGWVYEGEFANGAITGHGVIKFASGGTYDGEFVDQKRNGHGIEKFPDGSIYDGEWKDDKRNGHGKYVLTDGMYYDGEWVNDVKQGRGKFTEKAGEYTLIYEGEYIDGKREGRFEGHVIGGTSGKTYLRFFKNDESIVGADKTEENKNWTVDDFNDYWRKSNEELKRNIAAGKVKSTNVNLGNGASGAGIYNAIKKVVLNSFGGDYDGDTMDGRRCGYGECAYSDGDEYKGCWKNDTFNGVGRYDFAGGGWYFGQFENGQMNGYGVCFDGKDYHFGRFIDGSCVTEQNILNLIGSNGAWMEFDPANNAWIFGDTKNQSSAIMKDKHGIQYGWKKNGMKYMAVFDTEAAPMMYYGCDSKNDKSINDDSGAVVNVNHYVYIGSIKGFECCGRGTIHYTSGDSFDAEFENGEPVEEYHRYDKYGNEIE